MLCVFLPQNIYAYTLRENEENNYETEEFVDELFSSFDDRPVIHLPDGDYLQGECTIVDAYDESIVYGVYNSETSLNSFSVEEAKMEVIGIENGDFPVESIEPRGADVPSQTKIMTPGSHYTSNKYTSKNGWRFSGYLFRCANGSAGYQTWRTFVDGGRIGALGDAINQKNNPNASYGHTLNVGTSFRLGTVYSWGYGSFCYYTYAPISGTYYTIDFE